MGFFGYFKYRCEMKLKWLIRNWFISLLLMNLPTEYILLNQQALAAALETHLVHNSGRERSFVAARDLQVSEATTADNESSTPSDLREAILILESLDKGHSPQGNLPAKYGKQEYYPHYDLVSEISPPKGKFKEYESQSQEYFTPRNPEEDTKPFVVIDINPRRKKPYGARGDYERNADTENVEQKLADEYLERQDTSDGNELTSKSFGKEPNALHKYAKRYNRKNFNLHSAGNGDSSDVNAESKGLFWHQLGKNEANPVKWRLKPFFGQEMHVPNAQNFEDRDESLQKINKLPFNTAQSNEQPTDLNLENNKRRAYQRKGKIFHKNEKIQNSKIVGMPGTSHNIYNPYYRGDEIKKAHYRTKNLSTKNYKNNFSHKTQDSLTEITKEMGVHRNKFTPPKESVNSDLENFLEAKKKTFYQSDYIGNEKFVNPSGAINTLASEDIQYSKKKLANSAEKIQNKQANSRLHPQTFPVNRKLPFSKLRRVNKSGKTHHINENVNKYAERMHIKGPPATVMEFLRPEMLESSAKQKILHRTKQVKRKIQGDFPHFEEIVPPIKAEQTPPKKNYVNAKAENHFRKWNTGNNKKVNVHKVNGIHMLEDPFMRLNQSNNELKTMYDDNDIHQNGKIKTFNNSANLKSLEIEQKIPSDKFRENSKIYNKTSKRQNVGNIPQHSLETSQDSPFSTTDYRHSQITSSQGHKPPPQARQLTENSTNLQDARAGTPTWEISKKIEEYKTSRVQTDLSLLGAYEGDNGKEADAQMIKKPIVLNISDEGIIRFSGPRGKVQEVSLQNLDKNYPTEDESVYQEFQTPLTSNIKQQYPHLLGKKVDMKAQVPPSSALANPYDKFLQINNDDKESAQISLPNEEARVSQPEPEQNAPFMDYPIAGQQSQIVQTDENNFANGILETDLLSQQRQNVPILNYPIYDQQNSDVQTGDNLIANEETGTESVPERTESMPFEALDNDVNNVENYVNNVENDVSEVEDAIQTLQPKNKKTFSSMEVGDFPFDIKPINEKPAQLAIDKLHIPIQQKEDEEIRKSENQEPFSQLENYEGKIRIQQLPKASKTEHLPQSKDVPKKIETSLINRKIETENVTIRREIPMQRADSDKHEDVLTKADDEMVSDSLRDAALGLDESNKLVFATSEDNNAETGVKPNSVILEKVYDEFQKELNDMKPYTSYPPDMNDKLSESISEDLARVTSGSSSIMNNAEAYVRPNRLGKIYDEFQRELNEMKPYTKYTPDVNEQPTESIPDDFSRVTSARNSIMNNAEAYVKQIKLDRIYDEFQRELNEMKPYTSYPPDLNEQLTESVPEDLARLTSGSNSIMNAPAALKQLFGLENVDDSNMVTSSYQTSQSGSETGVLDAEIPEPHDMSLKDSQIEDKDLTTKGTTPPPSRIIKISEKKIEIISRLKKSNGMAELYKPGHVLQNGNKEKVDTN